MPDIEETLAEFVQGAFRSFWALDVLLLLQQDAARIWSAAQLVQELRGSPPLVADILADFAAMGLVSWTDETHFRFHPASEHLAGLCRDLAAVYHERPFAVRKLIAGASSQRLRVFSDAFRLKGS